jgi:hypothetical protein
VTLKRRLVLVRRVPVRTALADAATLLLLHLKRRDLVLVLRVTVRTVREDAAVMLLRMDFLELPLKLLECPVKLGAFFLILLTHPNFQFLFSKILI